MNKFANEFLEVSKGLKPLTPCDVLQTFNHDDPMIETFYEMKNYILGNINNYKCFLVLGLKEITWRKELENKFDINPNDITKFFDFMKKHGLVLYRPLYKVSHELFEALVKQNSIDFYKQRVNVKVYTLSPMGNKIFELISNSLKDITTNRNDLQIELRLVLESTEAHRKTLERIRFEEDTCLQRKVIWPDGIEELRETNKSKLIKLESEKQHKLLKQENQTLLQNEK